ncbi:metallophosphoesterase [Marinilactibacillus psychrotolerans]
MDILLTYSCPRLCPHLRFKVLLSHRPELFETYAAHGFDLVFSGHAHGGQFRLPFIGGLIAPNQGLFPEYTAGIYSKKQTRMIVSRGLGNSVIPIRINNRPELVIVTLSN